MSLTPDEDSIGYLVIVTAWVCPAITLPVFLMRVYSALRLIKRWHWDDTLMVLAFLFAFSNSLINSFQVRNGLGDHISTVGPEKLREFSLLSIAGATVTYNLTLMCTKSSILLYYLRFPASRAFRAATYFVLFASVSYTFAGLMSFAYSCRPMRKSWDKGIEGTCMDIPAAYLARAVINVATDLCILLLPVWLLSPLRQWSRWYKLSVLLVLMAGGFVLIASSLRLAAFVTEQDDPETDMTFHYVKNTNWCLLETWAAVFCACLPSLKIFFVHKFPHMFSSNRNNANRRIGSLLSMIRISVTDNRDEPAEPPRAWQFASKLRKKPSVGSSDPDLEAQEAGSSRGTSSSGSNEKDGIPGAYTEEKEVTTEKVQETAPAGLKAPG